MALTGLSRRERQIMEILYQHGKVSAADVRAAMEDAPSYSAVRAMLRVLEDKGHVKHQAEGLRYVYVPVVAREKAKRSAMKQLLNTFFSDSPEQVVAALLDVSSRHLTSEELNRMAEMIEKAKGEGKSLLSLLMGVALKSVVVLAVAWAIALALRGRSAAARHVVWTSASAALLALPVLSVSLPVLRVPVAPVLLPSAAVFQTTSPDSADTPKAKASRPEKATATGKPVAWRPDWFGSIILLWAVGAAAGLAQLLASSMAMARVRRRARPLACADLAELTEVLGIVRPVEVLEGQRGSMPMAFGVFRPAVFLPADARDWDAERRRMVLLHELAHIRRGDLATHLLARIALSLYWWNPMAWSLWRESLKERERAADDLVLRSGARASNYAGHLLEIARTMRSSPAIGWAVVAMARPSQLEGRLLAILDSRVRRNAPGRGFAWAATLLAVGVVAPFAALQAQDKTATLPADVDATIRAAVSQKNHEMLESAAKAAEVLQQFDVAQQLLQSALAIRADVSGTGSVDYGLGLLKLGDLERSRNSFSEAEAFYTKAVSVLGSRPEAASALVHLGLAVWKRDLILALDYFQKAQAADPAHAGPALMWMAMIRERQGGIEEAESLFKDALAQEDPNSAEAALTNELYATFLDRRSRADEAAVLRARAIAIRNALGAQAVTVRRSATVSTVFRMGNMIGLTPPRLSFKVEPQYTEEARLAKYQGTVVVAVDIAPDGTAQNMKVVRGLGLGLEEQALKAISQWLFKPGTKDGQPVAVKATIEVNFRLL